jgi:hypothetical protein
MSKPQVKDIFAQPVPVHAPPPEASPIASIEHEHDQQRRRSGTNFHRTTRHGVATYLTREAHRQLKRIAFEEDEEMQELVRQGINLVFRTKGLPEIA